MAPANREQILNDIRKAAEEISRIETKLEFQGFKLSNDNKEHGKYYDIEEGIWEYSRELENAYNFKRTSERALESWDEKFSSGETSDFAYNSSEEVLYEQYTSAYENSTPLDNLCDFSERVVDRIACKALKALGIILLREVLNTSDEGRIGAAALGGTALAFSLADGQIDSLETLGAMGLFWVGMKIGEAVTPAEKFYEKGLSNVSAGNINGAIDSFGKAISKDKNYCDAYFQRGCLYSVVGKIKQALSDFNKTIELNSQHSLAYTKRASIYYALKQYDDAIRDFTIAIAKEPSHENYYMRALTYSSIKRYNESHKDLSYAIQFNPKEPSAYLLRGCIALDCQKKVSEAIKDFNQAIQLAPTFAEAYICQARAYFKRRNIRTAINFYTKAIGFGDKEIQLEAYSGRCLAYIESNEIWKARFDAFKSGTRHPALKIKASEFVAGFGLITIVPAAFFVSSLSTFMSQDMKPETKTVVESENLVNNELVAPSQISESQSGQQLVSECHRFSLAMQSATEVQSAFSEHLENSDIAVSTTSIEKIIRANSKFSSSLSSLSLQDKQLIEIQKEFIELSGDIYMNQYHKMQALEQLKNSHTSTETNMLSSLYLNLSEKDFGFSSRYVSLLNNFNTVCGPVLE